MKLAFYARPGAVVSLLALCALPAAAQQVLWKDNPITGKVVGLTYGTSGWNAAEAQAVAYGGHLVTIRSQTEQDWLVSNFASQWPINASYSGGYPRGPWIGLNRLAPSSTDAWSWIGGDPSSFRLWHSSEPNQNAGSSTQYANLWTSNESWAWADDDDALSVRSLIEVQQRPARSWSWTNSVNTTDGPYYGCLGDFDGDGILDYASPNRFSNSVAIYRGLGNGAFGPGQSIMFFADVHTVRCADMNSDNRLDIVGVDYQFNGSVRIAINDGWTAAGGFAFSPSTIGFADYGHWVVLGDFNSDGRNDVATGHHYNNQDYLRIFRNENGASYSHVQDIVGMQDEWQCLAGSDLDGDSYLDIISTSGFGDGVRICYGSASGFGAPVAWSCNSPCGVSAAADIDGDGDVDIVAPGLGSGKLWFWRSSGARTFEPPIGISIATAAFGVAVLDADGDQDSDVAVVEDAGSISIVLNESGVLVRRDRLIVSPNSLFITTADLNNDAKFDLLTSSFSQSQFSVILNQSKFDCNGNGIDDPIDIANGSAADCNGNGRPDSCDLAFGYSQDSNGNGILDECEPTLVSLSPAVRAAFTAGTVAVATTNVPNGVATLTLSSPSFAQPIVRTFAIANNAGSVTLPALSAPSASDVVASGTISFTDALGNTVVTDVTADVFTWDVPRIVSSVPSNAPYDQATSVVFTLAENTVTNGIGTARFGVSPLQTAYIFSVGSQTWVSTIAPAQPAPGPVDVLLQFGSEYTLAQRGFVFLGPGVTNLSVTSGWQAGGEALDVELYGFAPNVPVDVIFGSGAGAVSVAAVPSGVAAQSFLSLTTPYLPTAGALDFTVVQNAGLPSEKRVVSPGAWLAEAPRIAGVSPSSGFQGGGDLVTLTLEGFPAGVATRVELGSQVYNATNSGTLDLSTASLTTTLAPLAGPVDVNVRQGLGGPTPLNATLAGGFTVIAPTFTSVSPSSGPREGGTQVVAQTSGFDATIPAQVQLGGTILVGTVSGSGPAQTVSFRTTLATPGTSDVTISQGVLTSTLPGAFTFNAPIVSNYCQAKLTSAGTLPVIGFTGSPSASTGDFAITLSNALPNKNCLYFSNFAPSNLSFNGGKLCVSSSGILRGPTSSTDASSFASVPFPVTPAAIGTNRYFQWWFRDPADPFTVGLSGGLRILGFYP